MIAHLKPYPTMKDSDVEWLGEVPEHWEVRRLRTISEIRVSNVDKHTKGNETPVRLCNYVDVYKNDRISEGMAFMRATATSEEIERFRLASSDVLITKDSETWDDIGVPALVTKPANDLISGYHLALLRPFTGLLCGGYLFRALQSKAVAYQFHVEANGVTRYGLSRAGIKSVWFPLPPLPEQTAIVRFLDHVDRRIRRYIRAKQKLIGLLEEQKQAIIHRAVTRGLDPNVRLKPSGVEWLGGVPEHWEVKKLKYLSHQIVDGTHFTPTYVDEGVPFLRVTDIQSENLNMASLRRISEEEHALLNKRCNPARGDLLLSKNGTIGLTKVVEWDFPFSIFVSLCLIKPIACLVDAHFISFAFRGGLLVSQLSEITKTTSVTNLHLDKIRDLAVPVPPLDEQRNIMATTSEQLRPLDGALKTARREISLVREYRTRLIADVVTGKLDVREAAANLLEEHDEPEALADADDPMDRDEEMADELDAIPEEAEA